MERAPSPSLPGPASDCFHPGLEKPSRQNWPSCDSESVLRPELRLELARRSAEASRRPSVTFQDSAIIVDSDKNLQCQVGAPISYLPVFCAGREQLVPRPDIVVSNCRMWRQRIESQVVCLLLPGFPVSVDLGVFSVRPTCC